MSDLCAICHLPIEVGDYPCISSPRPHQRGINGAIGDECDIWQENGFRHPRHFTSKKERTRALAANGLEEQIRHVTVPGTDKSPYTTDWSKGSIDAYTLESARVLMSRNGSSQGNDPEPEPIPIQWQVREVNSKTGPGPWRDIQETR